MPAKIHAFDENTNQNEQQLSNDVGSRKASAAPSYSQAAHKQNGDLVATSPVMSFLQDEKKPKGDAVPSVSEMVPYIIDLDEKANADEKKSSKSIHLEELNTLKWKEMNGKQKAWFVTKSVLKVVGLLGCLYFFICSLEIMSISFRLVGGKYVSQAFQSSVILKNPLAGLMIGIIVTVVVQSSSTSTSIVVTMVASELLSVHNAVPIIMGANIGTSITSTIVSLTHLGDREQFFRAFAGAIIHDMFNFLSVIVLLPIEIIFKYLEKVSGAIVNAIIAKELTAKEPELLNAITKPLTSKIVQLDKAVLELIALGNATGDEKLLKHRCGTVRCDYLLEPLEWPEWSIGLMLLIISLAVLCTCLILLVKILSSIFRGSVAHVLQKLVNADFPGFFKYLTPYVAILVGAGLTIVVQSSSVFTSTLVPLVGMGLVSIERVFPLVLGSNIGTTITGILAAFSASSRNLSSSLQIALCHTLFNITGIIIWYPIPVMRRVPFKLARFAASKTHHHRWFAGFYLFLMFLFVPIFIFGLSIAGLTVMGCVLIPIALLIIFVLVVNEVQDKRPHWLPNILKTWDFLPLPLRSLDPYDKYFAFFLCCKSCKKVNTVVDEEDLPSIDSETFN